MAEYRKPVWQALAGPLAAECSGTGDQRLVFAHGFTQTANSWKPIAEYMVGLGYEVVVVDLPGHGGSSHVRADLRRGADMLTSVGGDATYIGYSMGGRFALHAAVMYPNRVRRMALIGANPGIDDDGERAERRVADEAMAVHLTEVGVEAFVDEWMTQPLFAGLRLSDDDRADRLRNTVEGLTSSLRIAGTGAQGSLWPRLRELAMPVLAMAGEHDSKFVAIGSQIARAVRDGSFVAIPGAGHAAHLDNAELVVAELVKWTSRPPNSSP